MIRAAMLAFALGCADTAPEPAPAEDVDGVAPLATPSAACPELGPGVAAITSGGLERRVTVVVPEPLPADPPVLFTFHGLSTPDQDPMGAMVAGLGLQAEADARGVIFVVPEARTTDLPLVGAVSLWGILDDEAADLTLYDDLRTCVAEAWDVDLSRVGAWGHSGGALWTTVLARERADTLAAVVELSGGADIVLPVIGGPFVDWDPVGRPLPALLVTGGDADVWPDAELTLIDFVAATDVLTEALVAEGQPVGRCDHGLGHFTIPSATRGEALDWLLAHRFGEPSPVEALGDDCWWP